MPIMNKYIPSKPTSIRHHPLWIKHSVKKMTRKIYILYNKAKQYTMDRIIKGGCVQESEGYGVKGMKGGGCTAEARWGPRG